MIKKLFSILSISLFILFLTGQVADAAGNLAIRIEQPKSPTNQDAFNLVFVTLDIQGQAITVKCFKKGPTDVVFTQFGGDIAVSDGGNTGNCPVNSSIMNTAGTYQFFATATANSDVSTSTIDSVDFNTSSGPGTPSNFSKDRIDSCQYKISYKTADDGGKTVKVELYRSDNQTFTADSGTRVDTHTIGSNTTDSFTNSVPDCNKEYFYVLRAFDSFGNGSGLVGDSSVTITTTTGATTTTAGATAPAAGAIVLASNPGAETLGQQAEEITASEEDKTQEEVKGVQTKETPSAKLGETAISLKNLALLGIPVIIIATIVFYVYSKRKKA